MIVEGNEMLDGFTDIAEKVLSLFERLSVTASELCFRLSSHQV